MYCISTFSVSVIAPSVMLAGVAERVLEKKFIVVDFVIVANLSSQIDICKLKN